jgi:hypothetical protein
MIPMRPNSEANALSVEALATGWQELARQMRFLALRGKPVHPEDLKQLQALLQRGTESIGAIARGETNATLGLQVQSSQRGIAMRMLQSGCPAADGAHPSESVDRAPSRTHVLALGGSDSVLTAQELVMLLAARRQVGILKLRTEREIFTLELDRNEVAHLHTSSAAEGERLGDVLACLGMLSAQEVDNVRQHNPRGRLGEALLGGNFVSEAQLLAALETQIHLLIGRLCQSRILNFSFWQGPLVFARPRLRIAVSALMLTPGLDQPDEAQGGAGAAG